MRYAAIALSAALSLAGCFLDRGGLPLDQEDGGGIDGGPSDGGRDDAGPDSGPIDGGPDAGPIDGGPIDGGPIDGGPIDGGPIDGGPIDGGPIDGGPVDAGCTSADDRCEGETAVQCVGGALVSTDCAAAAQYCDVPTSTCMPQVCTPAAAVCSSDQTSVTTCNANGSDSSSAACSRGCDAGACRAPTACSSAVAMTITGGTHALDLCGAGDDRDFGYDTDDDCNSFDPGEDLIVRLDVNRAGMYQIEVVDDDGSAIVDPLVYVWTACDDGGTQIWCDDDSRGGGEARMTVNLTAGDYFVIVDSLNYDPSGSNNERTCGNVELIVTRL